MCNPDNLAIFSGTGVPSNKDILKKSFSEMKGQQKERLTNAVIKNSPKKKANKEMKRRNRPGNITNYNTHIVLSGRGGRAV